MTLLPLMPTVLFEKLANALLKKDVQSSEKLRRLAGKRIRLKLKELPFTTTVSVDEAGVYISTADTDSVDCCISTELGALPELQDTANLTRLIKADQLDIEGDPMLAQQLVGLFKSLDVDWEAELANTVGDAPAHWLMMLWHKSRSHVEQRLEEGKRWLKGVVTDEKQLLPTREEFNEFKDNMQQLRAKVERLQRQCEERKS